MAKRDINRLTGKIGSSLQKQRRDSLAITFGYMDMEERYINKLNKKIFSDLEI